MKVVPNFAEQVKDLASKAIFALAPTKAQPEPKPKPTQEDE
jgi:hypothetical protein